MHSRRSKIYLESFAKPCLIRLGCLFQTRPAATMARTIGRAPKVVREELRRILPEGKTDFDAHTGRDMAACMSHVNSYLRGSMGWASPMDLASALFPKGLLDAYGIERIEPREVNLTPSLVPHAVTQL